MQVKMKKNQNFQKKFKFSQKNRVSYIFLLVLVHSLLIFTNCKTIPTEKKQIQLSRKILGQGILNEFQLTSFFLSQNPDYNYEDMVTFAGYYISEAAQENINSDVAFAQMCLETGYLRFGNLVTPEMNNFCGLGAMDINNPGCVFETKQMGVRAHIQHLQAYATTQDVSLNNELIDPRYSWVHKTKFVEDIFGLAGTWATDKEYGNKLDAILSKMSEFVN